ncbi:hypothetical protein EVAR_96019_1 [Eumeta japonica]|uniref:Uncharacterized protein n=1 Tax=Eumeta variegata TaxID=151549 RepID=A0A4C1XHW5_EUMVA|nr:hypothetical protein EVAR_96019_1 [Eumeta japonica]
MLRCGQDCCRSQEILSRRLGVVTGCVRPLSLFYSDVSADGVEERSLVPRSLARSAQAERDNESCFFTENAIFSQYRREVTASAVVFRPVSESSESDGPLALPVPMLFRQYFLNSNKRHLAVFIVQINIAATQIISVWTKATQVIASHSIKEASKTDHDVAVTKQYLTHRLSPISPPSPPFLLHQLTPLASDILFRQRTSNSSKVASVHGRR